MKKERKMKAFEKFFMIKDMKDKNVDIDPNIRAERHISSHRPWPIGQLLVKTRKFLHEEIMRAIEPILQKQIIFNRQIQELIQEKEEKERKGKIGKIEEEWPDITIITLFAGREYSFQHYFHSLLNLDYEKKKLHLYFVDNSLEKNFSSSLRKKFEDIRKEYASAKLIKDKTRIFRELVDKSRHNFPNKLADFTEKHLAQVAALYNRHIPKIKTEYIFFFEDDVIIPSYTLKKFVLDLEDEKAMAVHSLFWSRHGDGMMVLNFTKNGEKFVLVPINKFDGVFPVGTAGTSCLLVKRKIFEKLRPPFTNSHQKLDQKAFDIVFGFRVNELGYKLLVDCDVRTLHLSPEGKVF